MDVRIVRIIEKIRCVKRQIYDARSSNGHPCRITNPIFCPIEINGSNKRPLVSFYPDEIDSVGCRLSVSHLNVYNIARMEHAAVAYEDGRVRRSNRRHAEIIGERRHRRPGLRARRSERKGRADREVSDSRYNSCRGIDGKRGPADRPNTMRACRSWVHDGPEGANSLAIGTRTAKGLIVDKSDRGYPYCGRGCGREARQGQRLSMHGAICRGGDDADAISRAGLAERPVCLQRWNAVDALNPEMAVAGAIGGVAAACAGLGF